MRIKDISNQKFNRLTALKFIKTDKYHNAIWECLCTCGKKKIVKANYLKTNQTKSCGCLRKEYLKKQRTTMAKLTFSHGMSKTPEFKAWQNAKDRCNNKRNHAYRDYGGRGIKFCKRWLNSFETFYEDMGKRPPKHSLDRINNNGNYTPQNCRWATRSQQSLNRRKSGNGRRTKHNL